MKAITEKKRMQDRLHTSRLYWEAINKDLPAVIDQVGHLLAALEDLQHSLFKDEHSH